MPKGKCPKCGKVYYGWALLEPEHQTCECGAKLEIEKNGAKLEIEERKLSGKKY